MYTNSRIKTFSELPTPKEIISKYEIGERRIDFIEFIEIAELLNIDLVDFIKKYK